MAGLSELAQIVVRYQRYDPATGERNADRNQREYADLLGVSRPFITQISNGDREPGVDILRALSRTFPAAADEIAVALKTQPEAAAV